MKTALLLLFLLLQAIDPGVASGTLQVGDQAIELKHAYAYRYDNEEGLLDGPELRVLLSDREVENDLLSGYDGPDRIEALVREGKLRGVLLRFDPRKQAEGLEGMLLFPPANPQASLVFFTSSRRGDLKRLETLNDRVTGEAGHESRAGEFGEDVPAFKFSATFSAPLFHDERVTARLNGAAAVRSAPAQALLAFERALRASDYANAQPLATEAKWREIEFYRAQAGEAAFREAIRERIPAANERVRQISRVIMRDKRAIILLEEAGGSTAISLVQVEGKWKID